MRRIFCIGLTVVALCAIQACNDNRKSKNYNHEVLVDDDGLLFIKKAAESGLVEVEASNIAKTTSQNPKVLAFAKMLVDHHAKINEEMNQLQSRNLINDVDSIQIEKQQEIVALSKKTGVEFDRAYMQMMVKDHEEAVKLFTGGTANRIMSVNKFAEKNLPALKQHLDSAKAIYAGLK